jgi:hypothetical protein
VAGDVLMLDSVGDAVLNAMGMESAAKGIIQPEVMPAAIRAVEAAADRGSSQRSAERLDAGDASRLNGELESVSLRQRAWPLVKMMRRAHASGEVIVWGV